MIARRTGGADGNDAREAWVPVPAVVDSDLADVAFGDGPAAISGSTPRVFAVGARGALIDCHPTECRAISTGTLEDLHAVAIAGGQAIAVGNGGTILHVTVDGDQWRARSLAEFDTLQRTGILQRDASDLFRAERVDAGVTTPLRAVTLTCDEHTLCRAKIFGEPDIVIEGEGLGHCDDGRTFSGTHSDCHWTWVTRKASRDDARPERPIVLPVHVETKRGLWRTDTFKTDAVVLSKAVRIGSMTMPLSSPVEVRAAITTPGGGVVVGADGELYAVQ